MPKLELQFNSPLVHAAILILLALPYFINLGVSSIWDANEAFYAETPREMIASGDYLAPKFNFQPRVQKPPLTYWAVVASYKVFGINEFAVRFPGALAALGILLFAYGMGRMLFSPRAAIFSAAITGTTARIFILERRLPIDILLLFFMIGALYFLLRAIHTKIRANWAIFYGFMAAAFMTKGPIAILIPMASFLIWLFFNRKSCRPKFYPFMGIAIFIALSLPYYLLIFRAHGWSYIAPFFISDNLGRFATEALGPSRGFFYYVPIFLSDFFPWSFIAIICAYLLWRRRHMQPPLANSDFGLLISWCLFTFVFFSLSKNKQEYYIAPIFPAAAVLIAGVLDGYVGRYAKDATGKIYTNLALEKLDRKFMRLMSLFYGSLAFLLFAVSLLLPFVLTSFIPDISFILHYAPSLILLSGAAMMMRCIKYKKYISCFIALAASLYIIFISGAVTYVPALEAVRPVKDFCLNIENQWCPAAGDQAGYFRSSLPSMVFYLKNPVFEEQSYEKMAERFRSKGRIFCILSYKDYVSFMDSNLNLQILDRRSHFSVRFSHLLGKDSPADRELLLVSNQLPSQTPCR
jgi:4-amino-4-deoxy-L-arabinose transferase-like glycosyltransferase